MVLCTTLHEHDREVSLLEQPGGRHDRRRRSSCFRRSRATSSWPFRRAASRSSSPTRAVPLDEGIPAVSAAHRAGAKAATDHLLALGHRRIGHISGTRRLDCARRNGSRATTPRSPRQACSRPPTSLPRATTRRPAASRRRERPPRPAGCTDRDLRGERQHGRRASMRAARERESARPGRPLRWSASTTRSSPRIVSPDADHGSTAARGARTNRGEPPDAA